MSLILRARPRGDLVERLQQRLQEHESGEAMQARSADHDESRPRNPEVEEAWRQYAVAYEARARLVETSSAVLVLDYRATEDARLRAIQEKNRECEDLLMAYLMLYDADQMAAYGTGN